MKVKTFVLITDFYNLNAINIHQTSELLYENLPATLLPDWFDCNLNSQNDGRLASLENKYGKFFY